MEVGIGGGKLVGFGDGTETEGLRGLRAECVRTIWHGAHHLALSKIFGQQNRVGGRVCHGRRVELVEAVDATVDGLLFDERSHGIVDEDFRAIGNACLLE